MKTLTLVLTLFVFQSAASATDFLIVRDATERVASKYLEGNPPKGLFTFAQSSSGAGGWDSMNPDLQKRLLASLGERAKQFVPLENTTKDEKSGMLLGPSKERVAVYFPLSIDYVSETELKMGFGCFKSQLGGHGVYYSVTLDGKEFRLKTISSFDA